MYQRIGVGARCLVPLRVLFITILIIIPVLTAPVEEDSIFVLSRSEIKNDDLKLELWLYRQGCWRPGAAGLAFLRFGGYLKLKKEDWSRR